MGSYRWKAAQSLAGAVVLAGVVLVVTATASGSKQSVHCFGFGHRHKFVCTTNMRLVCHPGTWTTLSRIPRSAYSGGEYRVSLLWNSGSGWRNPIQSGDFHGYTVKGGKFSVPSGGTGQAEALVNVTSPSPGGQFVIDVKCVG
jgi:hypothetical protein